MIIRPSSIEELLAGCDVPQRRLVEAARQAILAAVPTATERFRPGWGLIGYNAPAYFAFIAVETERVRVGFEWGVALFDPDRLLEGDGRQVRYVTVHSPGDLAQPSFIALLHEAAALRPPRRQRTRAVP